MLMRFGDFELDQSRRQLLRGGEALRLSPKAFQLLSILVRDTPRAISKADLQERLWPDTFVTEGNLATLVTELRSVLGDDAKEPRFIRTIYGFGYSFEALVTPSDENGAPVHVPVRRRRWAASAAVVIVAGTVIVFSMRNMIGRPAPATAAIHTIAVIPFDTTGVEPAEQHLGLGLADLLITRLSNVQQLTVRPTSAIRDYRGPHIDTRQAGRDLKVDALLEGSIRTSPDRVRVTVQLLNVDEQKPIWAETFDTKRAEMFSIEDNISERVAKALMVQVTSKEQTLLSKRYTTNPEAYELYVQGRYRLRQSNGATAWATRQTANEAALAFFKKALQVDPRYALAWAGMAQAHINMTWYGRVPPAVAWPPAEAAAMRAMQLDDNLAEAHIEVGAVKAAWHLDYAGAEKEFARAQDLNPSAMEANSWYPYLVQCFGRFDEAIALRKRRIEMNPFDPDMQWGLANAYLTAGRYDEAARQVQIVLGMNPKYYEAHIALIRIAVARGKNDEAIAIGRQLVESDPKNTQGVSFLGWAYGMAGRKDDAMRVLRSLQERQKTEYVAPFALITVYMGLGDHEAALHLLGRAIDDRSYVLRLKTEPVLLPLHSDPRFVALLRKAGFKD